MVMGYRISFDQADQIFLKNWAKPTRFGRRSVFAGKGRYSQTDLIRYDKVCKMGKSNTKKNPIYLPRRY